MHWLDFRNELLIPPPQDIGCEGGRRGHREGVRAAADGAVVVEPADQDEGGPRAGPGREAVRAGAAPAGDALLAEAAGRRRGRARRRRRLQGTNSMESFLA